MNEIKNTLNRIHNILKVTEGKVSKLDLTRIKRI